MQVIPSKYLESENPNHYMLSLSQDEKIIATLEKWALENKIPGGEITGIGAIKDVELGFYELESKTYKKQLFSHGDYELVSLSGNISLKEGKPYIHIHLSFAGEDFKVMGGHLFEATIAVVGEIFVYPLGRTPERELNDKIGLAQICKLGE